MQVQQIQKFEGYWENDRFYPQGNPIRKKGRQRAVLTFINEPVQESTTEKPIFDIVPDDDEASKLADEEDTRLREEWLKKLKQLRELAKDDPLLDFPVRQPMREPHGLTD